MKLTRADITFAQHVAFVRQFPTLAANNETGFSADASVHGCINSHAYAFFKRPYLEVSDRSAMRQWTKAKKTYGENWHNTLAIIRNRIRRNDDWKILESWIFEGAYGPRHKVNVLRLLRRMK